MNDLSLLEKDINKIADSLAAKDFKNLCKNSNIFISSVKHNDVTILSSIKHSDVHVPISPQKILIKIKKAT